MITCYFGVPGCGKTTLLTKFAVTEARKVLKGKSRYKHVYTNFFCVGCEKIDFHVLDKYCVRDALIILDEITLDADNREFKSFSKGTRDFFVLHRHLGNDIIYATQSFELVDLKIRQLTQELWYMSRSVVPVLRSFTTAKRIYREVAINEHTSELTLGYRFCNIIESFFVSNCKIAYRRKWYKYFDSYDDTHFNNRLLFQSSPWQPFPLSKGKRLLAWLNSLNDKLSSNFDYPLAATVHSTDESSVKESPAGPIGAEGRDSNDRSRHIKGFRLIKYKILYLKRYGFSR